MLTLLQIAWRNLWRNKRRSLIVAFSIGFGILAMILSIGFMNGFNNQMVENTINTSLGHIAIHQNGWQKNPKLEKNFHIDQKMISAVKQLPNIAAYAPRVKVQGIVRSSAAARGVMINGIDPLLESKVSRLQDYTSKEKGSAYFAIGDEEAVLISQTLATKLDLRIGEKLVVMVQDKNMEIVGVGLTIKGIYQTPIDTFDKFMIFVPIGYLQKITGIGNNVTELNILLNDKKTVDLAQTFLKGKITNSSLEILSWKDMAPNLVSAIKLFDSMVYIFFAIVFITVIFSVANTMIMAIMERFHELGVMKSIGTKPSWIFWLIIFEAVNLGFVGLFIGTFSGLGIVKFMSWYGIDFSVFSESMRVWGTGSIIYPSIRFKDLFVAMLIVLVTTVLAAIYPAIKATRIKPLEALNHI